MEYVFAPGCALMIYKPHIAEKLHSYLQQALGDMDLHLTCCRHEPRLSTGTTIINVCAGCDNRYRTLYPGISTVSLWEQVADSTTFPFPDHSGLELAVQDACPTRTESRVHDSVRKLLERMNITVTEAEHTRTRARCCGDSLYPGRPIAEIKDRMKARAGEMPVQGVAVYCVSCIKSMHIGGKTPYYIPDLLFNEATAIGTYEPDEWHGELEQFINEH